MANTDTTNKLTTNGFINDSLDRGKSVHSQTTIPALNNDNGGPGPAVETNGSSDDLVADTASPGVMTERDQLPDQLTTYPTSSKIAGVLKKSSLPVHMHPEQP